MALNFPNLSRSFEARQNRVQFWGYDSAIEITFFLDVDALMKISPDAGAAETGLMDAFDCALDQIHQIARKVYERSRNQSCVYVLAAADF